jgi:hypothetical protein
LGIDVSVVEDDCVVTAVKDIVLVSVGRAWVLVGSKVGVLVAVGMLNAVLVNWAETVSTACVNMAFASNVGSAVAFDAQEEITIIRTNISIKMLVVFLFLFICCLQITFFVLSYHSLIPIFKRITTFCQGMGKN